MAVSNSCKPLHPREPAVVQQQNPHAQLACDVLQLDTPLLDTNGSFRRALRPTGCSAPESLLKRGPMIQSHLVTFASFTIRLFLIPLRKVKEKAVAAACGHSLR